MALRAGYYGVKRGLKDKLAQIAGAWDQVKNEVDDLIDIDEVDLTSKVNSTNFSVETGGFVKYGKIGNVCTITLAGITPTSTGNNKALLSDANVPKALLQTIMPAVSGNGSSVGMINVPTNYVVLNIGTVGTIYSSVTYLVDTRNTQSRTAEAPEEIVKDEVEEPVVEKKTTRKKSTAKADTKEEV